MRRVVNSKTVGAIPVAQLGHTRQLAGDGVGCPYVFKALRQADVEKIKEELLSGWLWNKRVLTFCASSSLIEMTREKD